MVHDDRLTDDLVQRMYVSLASALRRSRRDPFGSPVTVAEIYQDLIPYRSVRSRLGLEMNADYEHTLLRLLAGEAGLARLEPREARRELETEAASANPNVGLFRKFAACDVWITATDAVEADDASRPVERAPSKPAAAPASRKVVEDLPLLGEDEVEEIELDWVEEPAPEPGPAAPSSGASRAAPSWVAADASDDTWDAALARTRRTAAEQETADAPESNEAAVGADEPLQLEPLGAELLLEDEVVDDAAVESGVIEGTPEPALEPLETSMPDSAIRPSGQADGSCAFCETALPGGRAVKFCPFCGADQSMRPCASCGEPLEKGWRFCISCGATAPAALAAAT